MTRGRPAHPDVLTPREWEVLALIREGFTNAEIAQRLGISESGVRFHVSEILSKLGVSSRREAAAVELRPARRWALLSPMSAVSGPRRLLALLLARKTGVTVVAVAISVSAGVGYATLAGWSGGPGDGAAGARESNADACTALFTRQCLGGESQSFTTVEEAGMVASFQPSLPTYIPAGFIPIAAKATRPQGWAADVQSGAFERGCAGCDPRLSHNDQIGIYYKNAAGQELVVMQGFPAYFPFYESAPDDHRGTLRVGDRDAFWVRGWPYHWDSPQIALYFELGRVGTGWERLGDGTVLTGSPMSYSITSNGLPLEELIKIAESVSFK